MLFRNRGRTGNIYQIAVLTREDINGVRVTLNGIVHDAEMIIRCDEIERLAQFVARTNDIHEEEHHETSELEQGPVPDPERHEP
jgi:hypothetical protein